MSITNLRSLSPEERALTIFEHRRQSLPPDEQEAFRLHQHPCQDKGVAGLKAACDCARALRAELEEYKEVKHVEVGGDAAGWLLIVALSAEIAYREPYYRGYLVRRKVENAQAEAYKLPF
jgi:hypothetical protein